VTTESNTELMRRYLEEMWQNRDVSAIERYVDADVLLHDHVDTTGARDTVGLEAIRDAYRFVSTAFPDYRFTVEQLVGEGDRVIAAFAIEGTNTGELFGTPPTYRSAQMRALTMTRWENGKFVEGWQSSDILGLLRQLGIASDKVFPAPMRWMMALRGRREARRGRAASASR
jgi:predicted ester cyclase